MIENQIYYNYLYPNLRQIELKVNKIKKMYTQDMININKIYKKFLYDFNIKMYYKINISHKELVLKYIYEIINIFPQLKQIKISIFLHGSYAKGTNRLHSDIDLNFIYSEKIKNQIYAIEELISLIICYVFDIGYRDHIHNMMIYNVNGKNLKKFKYYNIIFNDRKKITYSVRDTKTHLINKIYKSKRGIKNFLFYIENAMKNYDIKEWCYSFMPIEGYNDYKIEKKLSKIYNNHKHNKLFYIEIIHKEVEKILNTECEFDKTFYIKSLNINLKKYYSEVIQNFLIIFSKINTNLENVNFIDLWPYLEENNDLIVCICEYFWLLMRVEEICYLNHWDFSYKSEEIISYNQFNESYNKLFGKNFNEEFEKIIYNLKFIIIESYERMI